MFSPLTLGPQKSCVYFSSAGEEACISFLLQTSGKGGHEQDTGAAHGATLPWTWVSCQPCFLSLEQDFKVPNLMSSPGWRRGKSHGPHTHRELRKAGSGVMGVKVSLQECRRALLPLLAGAVTSPGPSPCALDHIFCHARALLSLWSVPTSLFFLIYTHK